MNVLCTSQHCLIYFFRWSTQKHINSQLFANAFPLVKLTGAVLKPQNSGAALQVPTQKMILPLMRTPEKISSVQCGRNSTGFGIRSTRSGQGFSAQQLCDLGHINGDIKALTSRDLVRIQYHSVAKQLAQRLAHIRQSILVGYYFYYHYKLPLLVLWNEEYRESASG